MCKRILKLVKTGFSDAYIESAVWAMRDSDTSISDIVNAIDVIRKALTK